MSLPLAGSPVKLLTSTVMVLGAAGSSVLVVVTVVVSSVVSSRMGSSGFIANLRKLMQTIADLADAFVGQRRLTIPPLISILRRGRLNKI